MKRYLTILPVLAILVVLNLLAAQVFTRFDFTEGGIYTLSDTTKRVVKELPKKIIVQVFVSKKLPSQVVKIKQNLVDRLDEYAALAGGKLDIRYADPAANDDARKLAEALKIPELSLQIFSKDQRQILKTYIGLAVLKEKGKEEVEAEVETEESGDLLSKYEKWDTLPVISALDNFEYDFTSAIKKVSALEDKTIGFLTGHEEFQLASQQGAVGHSYPFLDVLGRNFIVKPVNLAEEEDITVDALVIAGPQEEFPEEELVKIHKFISAGGNVVVLLDRFVVRAGMTVGLLPTDFSDLLSPFGVSVSEALIVDAKKSNASFSQGIFSFSLPYHFWPKVQDLSKENPITAQLESLILPWASPLEIQEQENVNVEVLARSSERYRLMKEGLIESEEEDLDDQVLPINLDPQQKLSISSVKKDPLPLAVLAQKEGEGKVLIMGDADFLATELIEQLSADNMLFFFNALDSFTIGDDLISIRSKGVNDRPLSEISTSVKNLIRWGNIAVIPLLFVIYGVVRRMQRRARKNKSTSKDY